MIVLTKRFTNGEDSHCDARCYNSTHKKCTCVCKGLLHGKGEAYAKLNASAASMYLNLFGSNGDQNWPAVALIQDVQGR